LEEDIFWRENFQNREKYIEMMRSMEKCAPANPHTTVAQVLLLSVVL
jgi:hypothetical protein